MRTDSHDGGLRPSLLELRSPQAGRLSGRALSRSSKLYILGALALVIVSAWLWQLPVVHKVLRQSFTQLPTANTELYFTSPPSVSGTVLDVPITVSAHATAARSFTVKVWLVNGSGTVDTATSVTLTPERGTAATVVSLQVAGDAEVVYANLVGQPQTLHYRIAGLPIPTSTGGS